MIHKALLARLNAYIQIFVPIQVKPNLVLQETYTKYFA